MSGYKVPAEVWDAIENAPRYAVGSKHEFQLLDLGPILAKRVPVFLNTINLMLETNPYSILTEFDQWYAWTVRLIKMKATVLEWERTTNP